MNFYKYSKAKYVIYHKYLRVKYAFMIIGQVTTLANALKKLENAGLIIHPSIKISFEKKIKDYFRIKILLIIDNYSIIFDIIFI